MRLSYRDQLILVCIHTAMLVVLQLCGCVTVTKVGRYLTMAGGTVAGIGLLSAAGVLGGPGCSGGATYKQGYCGFSSLRSNPGGIDVIEVGVTVAAAGAVLWLLGAKPKAEPPTDPGKIAAQEPQGPAPPVAEDPATQRYVECQSPNQNGPEHPDAGMATSKGNEVRPE